MREDVSVFAAEMESRLKEKDLENGERGWLAPGCNIAFLERRLYECGKFLKNGLEDCDPAIVQKECIDVANFAMMIHSRLRCRP